MAPAPTSLTVDIDIFLSQKRRQKNDMWGLRWLIIDSDMAEVKVEKRGLSENFGKNNLGRTGMERLKLNEAGSVGGMENTHPVQTPAPFIIIILIILKII